MHRAFQIFKQLIHVLVACSQARAERIGRDHESLLFFRFSRGGKAEAEEMIHGAFERSAGALGLVLNQAGDVVIESECSAHIMMLGLKAS